MEKLILTEKEIAQICERIGKELQKKFEHTCPIFIGTLNGCLPFMSDLLKHIKCDLVVDYCQVSSYLGTTSTNVLQFKKDVDCDITNKDIVIVEDIVDTGQTLNLLIEKFSQRNPRSITTVTLLDKPCKRTKNIVPDFVGKTIDDVFVVGYGLDLDGLYRNIPFIFDYHYPPKNIYRD